MKKLIVLIGLVMAISAAQASDYIAALTSPSMMAAITQLNQSTLGNLINWKVGDAMYSNVTIQGMPINGTMTESVTKDNGDGTFWFNQTIDLMIQKQSADIEMNRADGKILKYVVNGQEQTPPDNSNIQIISQDYGSVTVPAGTFKAIHIVAKTQQQGQDVQIEEWANPKDTAMDGGIKTIMVTQGQTITMELTKFTKN